MKVEIIGFIASVITTVSFMPQVYKIFKTRRACDISLSSFSSVLAGAILWAVYGYLISSYSLIFTNFVITVLSGAIVASKFYFKDNPV